ncbi:MAG TPA: heme-binding protein [Rhizomicrobium sp.]|nr:heme-binding protein [Rhizomicrobium sp.]
MKLSACQVETLIKAAEGKAAGMNVPVCTTILDAGGHLKAFSRMDGAPLAAIDIAQRKAKTAVLLGMNSEHVWDFCKPGGPAEGLQSTNGGLVTFAGGIPLKARSGEIIGAIGVSGGTVSEDTQVVTAAMDAFVP